MSPSPELVVAVVFVLFVAAGVAGLLLVRKLGRTKSLVLATTERAKARADAAERTADRFAGAAEDALAIASRITRVDATADTIHAKVDVILNTVTGQQDVAGRPGRHARPAPALSVVPEDAPRYIA